MLQIPRRCYLLYRFHKPILLVALVMAVIGGYFTSKLGLDSDLAGLLPDSFESVQALRRMQDKVGGIGQLRIVLETDDFAAAKALAEDLVPRLHESSYVNYVDYRNDVEFYNRNALLFLDTLSLDSLHLAIQNTIDARKQELNPLFVEDLFGEDDADDAGGDDLANWEERYGDQERKEYFTNADSSVLVIKIFPSQANTNFTFIREMLSEVQGVVASMSLADYAPDLKVYYGGNFKNRLDEFEVVKKDILGTALYGFGGIFLLVVLYFRRLIGALLITVSLLFSLSWTFGLTYLVIGQLNTITGFLFVILFGLGIDYGIHAFQRYVESRQAGLDTAFAIEKMVCQTGSALATTAITTAAAFFSLTLMEFKGFSDLGFIAGVGILFAFMAMVVVLPTSLVFFEKLGLMRIERVPNKTLEVHRRPFPYARRILLVVVPLTLLAGYWSTRVGFEYDFTNLRAITDERRAMDEKTRGVFTLSESPAVLLADSREEVEEIQAVVREKIRTDTVSPTIETVRSVFSLVPDDQEARLARIREIRALIDEEADGVVTGEDKERVDDLRRYLEVDEPFTWDDFPAKDKRQFISKSGEIGDFVFVYPSVALRDGRNAINFRNDVGTITTASGKVFHAASSNIIGAEMLIIMVREGRIAGILTFVIVFVIVLWNFRSLKAAVLVLSPLAIGVVWMGGLMFLFGMKLNFFNIVVLPSVIGIGVDNGVHLCHRYLEEGPGSLLFVLRHTGLAIAMTTLTTIVGYSGLILASHPGLTSIGKLAVIGISSTFLTAVLVLPALIQWTARTQAPAQS